MTVFGAVFAILAFASLLTVFCLAHTRNSGHIPKALASMAVCLLVSGYFFACATGWK